MAQIEIDGVGKVYQEDTPEPIVAIDRIDLDIERNQFITIVGPSGCGKSTLLHMMGGFISASAGEIRLDGAAIDGPGPERGIVFQHFALFPWKTVMGNVEYGLVEKGMRKAERRELAQHYIGMQQRVALARMLACDPDILLMDEPFGALDAQTRIILQEELLDIWRKHTKTVVFVTHDVREAVFLSEKVVVTTARPGRIKRILETGLGAGAERLEVDRKAEEVWDILREEVLKTVVPSAMDPRAAAS